MRYTCLSLRVFGAFFSVRAYAAAYVIGDRGQDGVYRNRCVHAWNVKLLASLKGLFTPREVGVTMTDSSFHREYLCPKTNLETPFR